METKKTNFLMRSGILSTLLSLSCIAIIFEYCQIHGWSWIFTITEIVLLIVFISSFGFSFANSGLWAFSHKSLKKLDEREIALVSKALRRAYSIFTVIILIYLLLVSLLEIPVSMVVVASLIFMAHLMPASLIGWSEKEIRSDH